MRRSSDPSIKFSISIPTSVNNKLERHLSYDQSRSRFISSAIQEKLKRNVAPGVTELTTRQLMAALVNRNDVEKGLEVQLLHLLQ
jgi:metal-responsive CopG/Arc/MetJ family transcriptional regulator